MAFADSFIKAAVGLGASALSHSAAKVSYEKSGLAYPSLTNMSQKYSSYDAGSSKGSGSSSATSSVLPGTSTLDDYFNRLQSITAANNAWSAAQAEKQMDFQRQSAQDAMKFNHDEAELSRLWQERMSDTAHQREVKDLQAAGLNPVLSAMGGSGAPVTSGATASGYTSSGSKGDTDTSLAPALVSLLGSVMSAQASMANTITSATTQERIAQLGANTDIFKALTSAASAKEVASMQGQASRDVANIYGQTSRDVAGMNNETSKIVAQIGAGATISSARIHAAAQSASTWIAAQANLQVAQMNQLTSVLTHAMDNFSSESIATQGHISQERIASLNRELQRDLQKNGFDFQMAFAEDQYTRDWKLHMWDNGTDILQSLISGIGSSGFGNTGSGLLGLLKYFG